VDVLGADGSLEPSCWSALHPGDLVVLYNDRNIPADVLCLWSSETDQNVFVETKGLDGETNIKPKKSCALTSKKLNTAIGDSDFHTNKDKNPRTLGYKVGFENNNEDLNTFYGRIEINQISENVKISHLILRGCTLRNTARMIGLVVYTGHNTKVMLNCTNSRPKVTRLVQILNLNIFIFFGIVFVISALLTALAS